MQPYLDATLHFDDQPLIADAKVTLDGYVSFTFQNSLIRLLTPFYIPTKAVLTDSARAEMVEPAREAFIGDVKGAYAEWTKIQILTRRPDFDSNLFYEVTSDQFLVYDFSSERVLDELSAEDQLTEFLFTLVNDIDEGDRGTFVAGDTLEDALQKITTLYNIFSND